MFIKSLHFLLFVLIPLKGYSLVIYVDNDATGLNNGTSWEHAYNSLSEALLESNSGDSLWVKHGTYSPFISDIFDSFAIPSGVKVFGGFQGSEISFEQRNIEQNETVLTGFVDSVTNLLTVVYFENTSIETTLDGFIVEKGQSLYSTNNCSSTPNNSSCYGGGVYLYSGNIDSFTGATIANCTFSENSATFGGAIGINFKLGNGALNVDNSKFINNYSSEEGGAVYLISESGLNITMIISQSMFIQNSAFSAPSIFIFNKSNQANININTSDFIENQATYNSGAIYLGNGSSSNIEIQNCNFEKNEAGNTIIWPGAGGAIQGANFSLINCYFKENTARIGGAVNGLFITALNCIFEKNRAVTQGGAMRLASNNWIVNTTFVDNESEENGGAIYFIGGNAIDTIANCAFVTNVASQVSNNFHSVSSNNLVFLNSFFDAENPTYAFSQIDTTFGSLSFSNCIFQNNSQIFKHDINGNIKTKSCTPLRNGGSNAWPLKYQMDHDILGSVRILDGTVDIGAHEISNLSNEMIISNITCYREKDGSILANISGGCPPYDYQWSNGGDDNLIENLDTGSYQLIFSDSGYCIDTVLVEVEEPDEITLFYSVVNPTGLGVNDGLISIDSISGGIHPFEIIWEIGDTTWVIDSLPQGEFRYTIIDSNGCMKEGVILLDVSLAETVKPLRSIILYPNPTKGILNIEGGGNYSIEIFDSLGSEKMSVEKASSKIDISGLPNGLYFLKFFNDNSLQHTIPIIKN